MNRETLLRAAGEYAPDLMQKTARAVMVLEEQDPDSAELLKKDLSTITDYAVEKLAAGPGAIWGTAVGTAILGGVATNMAGDLYDAAKRNMSRGRNFNAIMKLNPDLKEFDKERLRVSFDALHRFGPEMTADPLVGGTLLRDMARLPGNEAMMVKDIIQNRKNIIDAKKIHLGPAMELDRDLDIQESKRKDEESNYRRRRDQQTDAAELAKETRLTKNKRIDDHANFGRQVRLTQYESALRGLPSREERSGDKDNSTTLKSGPTIRDVGRVPRPKR